MEEMESKWFFKEEIGRWDGGSRGLERLRASISGKGAAGGE
jgi:hypothetical protein